MDSNIVNLQNGGPSAFTQYTPLQSANINMPLSSPQFGQFYITATVPISLPPTRFPPATVSTQRPVVPQQQENKEQQETRDNSPKPKTPPYSVITVTKAVKYKSVMDSHRVKIYPPSANPMFPWPIQPNFFAPQRFHPMQFPNLRPPIMYPGVQYPPSHPYLTPFPGLIGPQLASGINWRRKVPQYLLRPKEPKYIQPTSSCQMTQNTVSPLDQLSQRFSDNQKIGGPKKYNQISNPSESADESPIGQISNLKPQLDTTASPFLVGLLRSEPDFPLTSNLIKNPSPDILRPWSEERAMKRDRELEQQATQKRMEVYNDPNGPSRRIAYSVVTRLQGRRAEKKKRMIRERIFNNSPPASYEEALAHHNTCELHKDPYLKGLTNLNLFHPNEMDHSMPQAVQERTKTAWLLYNAYRKAQDPTTTKDMRREEWDEMASGERQEWFVREDKVFQELIYQLKKGYVTIKIYEREIARDIQLMRVKDDDQSHFAGIC